jgi:hypothetical protein
MRCCSRCPYSCCGHHPTAAAVADPHGAVLEKEKVVINQGGRYDDDDEYEGGHGPTFTPPTKPCTGNRGTAGGFDHGDHGAAVVGSRAAAASSLGDPNGG